MSVAIGGTRGKERNFRRCGQRQQQQQNTKDEKDTMHCAVTVLKVIRFGWQDTVKREYARLERNRAW